MTSSSSPSIVTLLPKRALSCSVPPASIYFGLDVLIFNPSFSASRFSLVYCSADNVYVISKADKLAGSAENRAPHVERRSSNNTFSRNVEQQARETVALPKSPARFE